MRNKLFVTACLAAFIASGAYAADTSKTDGKTSDAGKTTVSATAPATRGGTASTKPATASTAGKTTAATTDNKTKSNSVKN